jgi:hypothetical protein
MSNPLNSLAIIRKTIWSNKDFYSYILIILLGVLTAFFELLSIGLIISFIEQLVNSGENSKFKFIYDFFGLDPLDSKTTQNLAIILISFFTIKTIYVIFAKWIESKFLYKQIYVIADKLMDSYFNLTMIKIKSRGKNELTKNVVLESQNIVVGVLIPFIVVINELVVFLFIFSLLLYSYPLVTVF